MKTSKSKYFVVPEIPATQDRRPYDNEDPDGYLEGNRDWAENNNAAVGCVSLDRRS